MTNLEIEIEAAFRKLPIAPAVGPGIPYETLIPGIAHELSWMRPFDRNITSPSTTRRNLIALKKRAGVISKDMAAVTQLPLDVRLIVTACAYFEIPELPPPARSGAPEKDLAALVARMVAEHYNRLTGKRPTRITRCGRSKAYGPFIELLTEIYRILGIKASPENQTRAVVKLF